MTPHAFVSEANVIIDRPGRYAKQLASHMGHKVPFEQIGENYEGKFGASLGQLEPGAGTLLMRVSADSLEALDGPQFALEKHLRKFASDQELLIDWKLVN